MAERPLGTWRALYEPSMYNQVTDFSSPGSVFFLPTEPIRAFLFSSTECQTYNKHQESSEPHPRPWGASGLIPVRPEWQENQREAALRGEDGALGFPLRRRPQTPRRGRQRAESKGREP